MSWNNPPYGFIHWLKLNTIVHRESNQRPFPCPHCDVSFSRRSVSPFTIAFSPTSMAHAICSDLRKRHVKKSHARSTSAKSPTDLNPQENRGIEDVRHDKQVLNPSIALTFTKAPQITGQNQEHFSSQDLSLLFKLPQYIAAYFDYFHPNLPALHQPTIDMATTKEPLLQAIACVGAVCHSPGSDPRFSASLFDAGCEYLERYVCHLRCSPICVYTNWP